MLSKSNWDFFALVFGPLKITFFAASQADKKKKGIGGIEHALEELQL